MPKWTCPRCERDFLKSTPQGLGMAKSNHKRGKCWWPVTIRWMKGEVETWEGIMRDASDRATKEHAKGVVAHYRETIEKMQAKLAVDA